jgi:hypothetical protein
MSGTSSVRAARGRLSALGVFLCKSVFYGVFVWARRALNRRKWRFPARAEKDYHSVCGTGHGYNGIEETIVYRYGQAKPVLIMTLK